MNSTLSPPHSRPTTCVRCGAKNSVMSAELLCGKCFLLAYPKAASFWGCDDPETERAVFWHRVKLWLFHRRFSRPQLTLGQRLKTCQFLDNTPLNCAFNVFVIFPLALLLTSAVAGGLIWPVGKLLQLDKLPATEHCQPTPFGCE